MGEFTCQRMANHTTYTRVNEKFMFKDKREFVVENVEITARGNLYDSELPENYEHPTNHVSTSNHVTKFGKR